MPTSSHYQYEIRKMRLDATPGELIVYAESDDVTFTWGLNKAGECTLHCNKPPHPDLWNMFLDTPGWTQFPPFEPASACLWILRDDNYVWAGPIWDVNGNSEQGDITIVAEEFPSYYDMLRLSQEFPYNNVTAYPYDILATLTSLEPYSLTMRAQTFGNGSTPSTPYRPIWHSFDHHSIGDLMRTLAVSTADTGFEFQQWIGMNGEYTLPGGPATCAFIRVWYPFAGRFQKAVDPEYIGTVELGPGTRDNCRKIEYRYSGRTMSNRVLALGQGDGDRQLKAEILATATFNRGSPVVDGSNMGVFENKELKTQLQVTQFAQRLIEVFGTQQLTATAYIPGDRFADGMNATYDGVRLGDWIKVRIVDNYLNYRGYLRIVGMGIHVVDAFHEEYELELAPSLGNTSSTVP